MTSLVAPFDAYKGNEPYIFVSYAHRNSEVVFEHIQKLHDAGYRIWYDEGIDPGADWSDEIAAALNNAESFLVFMSPEAANSHNVKKEIVFAVSKKKHMVCVYIAETELPLGLEMQLGNIQAIPETAFYDKNKFYERFLNAMPKSTKGNAAFIEEAKPAAETKSAPSVPIRTGDFLIDNGVLTRYLGSARVLTLPGNITKIGPQAFAQCGSLESVIIPDGVESIDVTAFVNCVNLITLFIPKTVTSIAYGAFTNCNKLTVKCWRDTVSHGQVIKAWRGPIAFLDDAMRPAASVPSRDPPKAEDLLHAENDKKDSTPALEIPENTIAFVPKGTAIITMRDGTVYRAVANTLLFMSAFEGGLSPRLYQGLDEKPEQSGYKLEKMIYFEDISDFTVTLSGDAKSGELIITDCDGEQQRKKLTDVQEELWFISQNMQTDMTVVRVAETAKVSFDFRSAPSYELPMTLIERTKHDSMLVPQAFFRYFIGDYSGVIPRFFWSTELPLKENGNVPIKRVKTIEVTKVIREAAMFQPYTEVELTVEKRNGERVYDKINTFFTLYVLAKSGLTKLALETVYKITINYITR